MIRPGRYFPWKIGRQFFFNQFVFTIIALVVGCASLRYYVYGLFGKDPNLHVALAEFDSYLTSLFFSGLIAVSMFHALTMRTYFRPLGRLIQRARELRKLSGEEVQFDADLEREEPGEWHDLERALNRVHHDMKAQTIALSHEREELSAIIGAVSDAILAVDHHEEGLFYNSQFAIFFKSKKASRLSEIFRAPEVLEAYRAVLKGEGAQRITSSLHVFGHASVRHFSVSVTPLKGKEDRSIYGAVGVFHDVSELKQAEQIRIDFVANASHELRTPLTSVKGYLETLRQDFKDGRLDDAEKFFDIISRNVDRLTFLVNDLLDLSTIESGAEIKKAYVNTRELTEAVFKALEERRTAKKQSLNAIYETDVVFGDAHRIEQVLVNLVYNAIKYIPEGKKVDVIWENKSDGAILRVRDNGPGVPAEHQLRLFERFYRVDGGRTRDQGGTGLGLSIVKHIMLKHGGSIQVKSTQSEGSEFICFFPLS